MEIIFDRTEADAREGSNRLIDSCKENSLALAADL